MKKLTFLESCIISFFIAIPISAYLVFVIYSDLYLSSVLKWISLIDIFQMLTVPQNYILVLSFIFYIAVYTTYVTIILTLLRKLDGLGSIIILLLFSLFAFIIWKQTTGTAPVIEIPHIQPAAIIKIKVPEKIESYFGNEVHGDLNSDGEDDIAFIIHRDDEFRGKLFYLSTALKTENGYSGTNLIFIGEKRELLGISLVDSIISIEYLDQTLEGATSTLKAHVENGVLQQVEP